MVSRPLYKIRTDKVLSHIAELDAYYVNLGIVDNSLLYNELITNDLFIKAVSMTIVLIGENCKGLQNYFRHTTHRNSNMNEICRQVRFFRNDIAHNYYALEVYDFVEILNTINTELRLELTTFKHNW